MSLHAAIENNKQLPASFSGLKYCAEYHNCMKRLANRKLHDIGKCGKQSAKYSCFIDWNNKAR